MLTVNQLAGFGVGRGAAVPILSFRGSLFSDTINVRTYSTTIDLGPEHPSRLIVVGAACITAQGESPTACTVDGAAATLAVTSPATGLITRAQLWSVARPTGGSVTVAFNKPGGADMDAGALGVWAVYNLLSQTPGAVASNHASPSVLDLSVPSNAVIAAVGNRGPAAITWGYLGVTGDAEAPTTFKAAFASASGVPAASPRDIELSGAVISGCSAYWR
jgi:hypothetical protein